MYVLRAESARFVWAKAECSPVLMRLALDEPLTDLQLLHLLGGQPVDCDIIVREWSDSMWAFRAAMTALVVPKKPPPLPARKRQWRCVGPHVPTP